MIDALQQMETQNKTDNMSIYVYSGDVPSVSADAIMARVRERFEIDLARPVLFVPLRTRPLVEAKWYGFAIECIAEC